MMIPWFHGALVLFAVTLMSVPAFSQQQQQQQQPTATAIDTTYRVELHLIGGFGGTKYVEPPSRYSTRETFFGYNVNARIMWHPDHLLSVGVMSGYQVFSTEIFSADNHEELEEDLRLELSSVPIHLAFEVRPLNIRFGAGIGAYLLLSQLEERNQITYSWDVAYGGSAWVGYAFTPVPRVRIGPDVVLQVLSDRGIANLSAMITLQYDLIVY